MNSQNLKVYSRVINNILVSFKCSEDLSSHAEFLFDIISGEQDNKNILIDNFKIQIGWTFYIFKENENEFMILSPDYKSNPFKDTTEDLTVSLFVQAQQFALIRKMNVECEEVSFQDTLMVLKQAINAELVYIERKEHTREKDSGWYLGLVNDEDNSHAIEDYQCIYVFQLLKYKPQLLQLLFLPVGYLVVINGDTIEEVIDKDDKRIL